jgi:hypothetical protein
MAEDINPEIEASPAGEPESDEEPEVIAHSAEEIEDDVAWCVINSNTD